MNCILIDDDKLLKRIIEEYIKRNDFLNLIGSFDSAIDAIPIMNGDTEIHLVFLDIEMPEMTGIEFLNSLKNLPQIIIMSSKDKYALEAFEYDVVDYLLKPVTYARFYKAIDKAFTKFVKSHTDDGIFIRNNLNALVRVNYDEIFYIEALENYIVVHTFEEKHMVHYTMKALSAKLPANSFVRIHRSFIVNVKKIVAIEDSSIVLKMKFGTKIIPIAKTYKDLLMQYINVAVK